MQRSGAIQWVVFGLLVLWLCFTFFPIYWTYVTAFKPPPAVMEGPTYLPWIDFTPTLSTLGEVFRQERGDIFGPLIASTLIGVVATIIAVAMGAMAAYALVRFEYRVRLLSGLLFAAAGMGAYLGIKALGLSDMQAFGLAFLVALAVGILSNLLPLPGPVLRNKDVVFWFVSQRMFPPIVSAFALYLLYVRLGREGIQSLDTFWGMVVCYIAFSMPIVVWLLRDFFQALPVEVEEAALVDNVPRWRIFIQIVIPMALPGLVAVALITFGFIWNEFLFALILTSSDWQTMPILISGQASVRGTEWWSQSSVAAIAITPMIVITFILARFMRSGLMLGAIK